MNFAQQLLLANSVSTNINVKFSGDRDLNLFMQLPRFQCGSPASRQIEFSVAL